jgi:hypothetical protein
MPFELPRLILPSEPFEKEELALAESEVLNTTFRVNTCVAGMRVNSSGYKVKVKVAHVVAAVVIVTPQGVTALPTTLPPTFQYRIFEVKRLNPLVAPASFPQKSSYPFRVLKSGNVDEPPAWQFPSAPSDIVPLHPANKLVIFAAVAAVSANPAPFANRTPMISFAIWNVAPAAFSCRRNAPLESDHIHSVPAAGKPLGAACSTVISGPVSLPIFTDPSLLT